MKLKKNSASALEPYLIELASIKKNDKVCLRQTRDLTTTKKVAKSDLLN